MKRLLLPALAAMALTACGERAEVGADPATGPAMWEIVGPGGAVEGWMLGTIHALPDGAQWRTTLLEDRLGRADMLVVEAAGLDDGAAMRQLFADMAFGRPQVPVAGRIDPDLRDEFEKLLLKARVRRDHFDAMESWAAALALAQVAQQGEAGNGADRALLADFEGGEVVELEGVEAQLAIFDALPEREQRDLIDAVLMETTAYEDHTGALARNWRTGNLKELARLTRRGVLADPELKQALLVERNRAWSAQLVNLLSAPRKPFVAVGTAHLLGPDGLPALLKASGYTVRRIQ